jgi:hypothetical protein
MIENSGLDDQILRVGDVVERSDRTLPDGFTAEGGLIKPNTLKGIRTPTSPVQIGDKEVYPHTTPSGLVVAHKERPSLVVTDSLPSRPETAEAASTNLTKVARAIHNPSLYLRARSEHLENFRTQKLTEEMLERRPRTVEYFDKNTQQTHERITTEAGLVEKYLVEAILAIHDPEVINSEAPRSLSRHAHNLLRDVRLNFDRESVSEMPDLIEKTLLLLNDESIYLDDETRSNIYGMLSQIDIPLSLAEEVLTTLEGQFDLDHDLALKLWYELKDSHPDSKFVQEQGKRRQELLELLSASPQEIVDRFEEITKKTRGLITALDECPPGKIGIEIEYKPDLKRIPHRHIPDGRFTIGVDGMNRAIEVRTSDDALEFGEPYIRSLLKMFEFIKDQPSEELKSLHVHLDTLKHPFTRELLRSFRYQLKDNLGTEVWGMRLPDSANGLTHLLQFLALGSSHHMNDEQIKLYLPPTSVNWDVAIAGHYCGILASPESRLVTLMMLRERSSAVLFNPEVILQSFSFDSPGDVKVSILEDLLSRSGSKDQKISFELWKSINYSLPVGDVLEQKMRSDDVAIWKLLAAQSALSEPVITQILERLGDEDDNVQYQALKVLKAQPVLPESAISQMVERLGDEDGVVRFQALEILGAQSSLPEPVIAQILERLGDEDADVRVQALQVLAAQSTLPESVITGLAERLGDEDARVRYQILRVLKAQPVLPESVISQMVERLGDEDGGVRFQALRVLKAQPVLLELVISQMVERLNDEDGGVRFQALQVLRAQATLPEPVITQVLQRLGDEDADVRFQALRVLKAQPVLPESVIRQMVERLGDEDADVRVQVLQVLGAQTSLPEPVITRLAERLGDEDADVRVQALEVLETQATLPEPVIAQVLQRLGDEDADVRFQALRVLKAQPVLPESVISQMVERLGDEDGGVRFQALQVLRAQTTLPEPVIAQVLQRLGDEDADVRVQVLQVLGAQTSLPEPVITRLAERLGDEDADVRVQALEVLETQATLPEPVIAQVLQRLGDEDADVRVQALQVLRAQTTLPEPVITRLAERLGDEDADVRVQALEVLETQTTLPESVISKMVERLGDEYGVVRLQALEALGAQATLPESVISKMVEWLGDAYIQYEVIEVLEKQVSLSINTLSKLSQTLSLLFENKNSLSVDLVCLKLKANEMIQKIQASADYQRDKQLSQNPTSSPG